MVSPELDAITMGYGSHQWKEQAGDRGFHLSSTLNLTRQPPGHKLEAQALLPQEWWDPDPPVVDCPWYWYGPQDCNVVLREKLE